MSCHGFLRNKNPVVVLKCPKRILESYFSKEFTLFYCNTNNLEKLKIEVKDRIHAEYAENYDKVMACINRTTPTSNTLSNMAVNESLHFFLYSKRIK